MEHRCRACGSTGKVTCPRCGGNGIIQRMKCYYCQGEGQVKCKACNGTGVVKD